MNPLFTSAIRKASEVRISLGIDLFEPINIYDICARMGIDVQFVDVNMEGLYINNNGTPRILLSGLRPFPRRVYTCAHELGHDVFNHGMRVDIIANEAEESSAQSDDEILVDAFAAALLMPVGGVQSAFAERNLSFHSATALDFYIISSLFGVGYKTLITHCKIHRLINSSRSIELLRFTPARIFKDEFGTIEEKSHFKIIDGKTTCKPIDLEVSNLLILPSDFIPEDDLLEKRHETRLGTLFSAKRSGITSVHSTNREMNYFVRIQPKNYIGFAQYRHL